jgi:hypothetical protein
MDNMGIWVEELEEREEGNSLKCRERRELAKRGAQELGNKFPSPFVFNF